MASSSPLNGGNKNGGRPEKRRWEPNDAVRFSAARRRLESSKRRASVDRRPLTTPNRDGCPSRTGTLQAGVMAAAFD
jgi:hypothetical protein